MPQEDKKLPPYPKEYLDASCAFTFRWATQEEIERYGALAFRPDFESLIADPNIEIKWDKKVIQN